MPIRKKRQPEHSTILTTRQAMYVQCYTEARSCNYCCSAKAKGITGYVRACARARVCLSARSLNSFSALSLCGVLYRQVRPAKFYNTCQLNFKNGTIFGGVEHGMGVSVFSKNSVWNISHSKKK
jgi:hypothetical protein